jgi:hypothetical protein
MTIIFVFLLGILAGSIGALLIKMGSSSIGPVELKTLTEFFGFLVKIFGNFTIVAGMGLYFFSAIAWTYLLTKLEISFVQPILGPHIYSNPDSCNNILKRKNTDDALGWDYRDYFWSFYSFQNCGYTLIFLIKVFR